MMGRGCVEVAPDDGGGVISPAVQNMPLEGVIALSILIALSEPAPVQSLMHPLINLIGHNKDLIGIDQRRISDLRCISLINLRITCAAAKQFAGNTP